MTDVKFAGYVYNFQNPIISLGLILFDVRKAQEWEDSKILSAEGELARLYLSMLGHPEFTDSIGKTINEIKGIDLANSSYDQIKLFMKNPTIKMSAVLNSFCTRVISVKDPSKFADELADTKMKKEYQLIKSHEKDISFLGKCGFHGSVFLDPNLT